MRELMGRSYKVGLVIKGEERERPKISFNPSY